VARRLLSQTDSSMSKPKVVRRLCAHSGDPGRRFPGAVAALSYVCALSYACGLALGCGPWPRDPERTLENAIERGTLRVGATESPPWLVRAGADATGREAELLHAFAESLGVRIEWQWGPLDDHMEQLGRFELDLVAAGLTAKSPWSAHTSFTRPYHEEGRVQRVLATAPGENRTLVALERLIERHKRVGAS